jgi:hypothetical protein
MMLREDTGRRSYFAWIGAADDAGDTEVVARLRVKDRQMRFGGAKVAVDFVGGRLDQAGASQLRSIAAASGMAVENSNHALIAGRDLVVR